MSNSSIFIKAKHGYLQEKHKEVILGVLIDAYNKIHDKTSGEHQFQFYQKLGADAFKQSKLELEQMKSKNSITSPAQPRLKANRLA
jgi:hypothetical protein